MTSRVELIDTPLHFQKIKFGRTLLIRLDFECNSSNERNNGFLIEDNIRLSVFITKKQWNTLSITPGSELPKLRIIGQLALDIPISLMYGDYAIIDANIYPC